MKFGVPFDVAFSCDESMRLAFCVVFGQFEGNEFDWQNLRWIDRT